MDMLGEWAAQHDAKRVQAQASASRRRLDTVAVQACTEEQSSSQTQSKSETPDRLVEGAKGCHHTSKKFERAIKLREVNKA